MSGPKGEPSEEQQETSVSPKFPEIEEFSFNEGPVAVDDTATTSENASISVDVLANDTDVDAGDSQALTSVSLVSGSGTASIVGGEVSFDPGAAYDDLAVGESATVEIDYVVSDVAGATDTGRLTLTLTGSNDGPTVSAALTDQSATEDASFSYTVPASSFADADTSDSLTYTATLADGSALPGWLSFDEETRTFWGTPANGDVGSIDVRVIATDPHGGSVTDDFTITTANSNDAPHGLALSGSSVNENAANGTVVGTAFGSDADTNDTLTYSLTDDAGGRFAIDSTTGQIAVADGSLPDHETATSHNVTVRATNSGGATYDEIFTVNITDTNDAPHDIKMNAVRRSSGTSTTVITEDFESGATGWSDKTTKLGGAGLDGNYLGDFAGTGGAQTIYKTFTLSGDQDSVTINFDFWEFDTWNGEEFKIWVDDVLISTDIYYTQQYYGNSDSCTYGTSTSGTTADLCCAGHFDQTHNYSFTIDSSATSIKLGFGTNLDEALAANTESCGIDNLEIIENQDVVTAPIEQPITEMVATGEIVSVGSNKSVNRWSLTLEGGDLTIDLLADGYNGGGLDSIVYLYRDDSGGSFTLIDSNDDGVAGNDGSTSALDSYISASDLAASDYIVVVGSCGTYASEAIASGNNDSPSAYSSGPYQMTITGNSTLNGIATDPTDGNPWGNDSGQATITSVSGGGIQAGTTVAAASVVDQDSGDTASYSLTNDAGGRYSIDSSGNVYLDVAHDGSAIATENITVRTTDGDGATYDETIQINLGSGDTDTLTGRSGDDVMHGFAGDDTDLFALLQGQGNDTVSG